MLLLPGHAAGGPLPLALGPAAQVGALGLVDGVVLDGVGLVGGALALIGRPAAPVDRAAAGVLVQLEDVGHRSLEEGAIVGDDDHAAGASDHHVLKPGQAVEVEIVGRLVEEGEVEAGEQNGGERHLGLLPTGQRRHGLCGDVGWERHLRAGADQSSLEVPGRDGLVVLEGDRVAILGRRSAAGQRRGRRGQLRLHGRHADAPGQGGGDGLVLVVAVLLAASSRRWPWAAPP